MISRAIAGKAFGLIRLIAVVAGLSACSPPADKDRQSTPSGATAPTGAAQPFGLADCKARLFDGSPAIAVMFTQPLARSQDWSKLAKAYEGEVTDAAKATQDGGNETGSASGQTKPATGMPGADQKGRPLEARWVLGENPRMLYLPYVIPNRAYRIELAADLASAGGGATLATAQNCSANSEAMPPAFYFASRGVVLPAGLNGGLPVVTVNTPEIDVQFMRIEDGALPKFLERVAGRQADKAANPDEQEGGEGYEGELANRRLKGRIGAYDLDQHLRDSAKSVYMSRFATDTRPNRRNVNHLPVEAIKELQEPGVYVAVMSAPGRFAWDYQATWFYVTDIGMHLRRHAARTDVYTTSLTRGQALADVEVSLLDEAGKALAQARTDSAGHAAFVGQFDKARLALARRGKELSVITLREPALDLSEYDIGGHPARNQKLFVYAGRDLYRPGEALTVSVLARDADGKALAAGAPPLTLTLKKPNGEKMSSQLVRAHALGAGYYEHQLTLPIDAPTGRWSVEARTDPEAKRADTQWLFQVEEFLPERMKLDLSAPEDVLQGGNPFTVTVDGNYLYGAPAAGNRLLGSASVERDRFALPQAWPDFRFGDADEDSVKKRQDLPETELDEQGHAQVQVPIEIGQRASPMKLRVSFSLLESGGRPVVRSIERSWWPAPTLIGLRPLFDGDMVRENELAEFEVTRVDAGGQFVASTELQLRLIREERDWYWRYDEGRGWNSGYNLQDELIETRMLALTDRGKISLPVTWGRYRVEILDPQTGLTARYRFHAGWGAQDADDIGNRPDRVQLKLTGAPYGDGDQIKLSIKPPHDGEALITVESDRPLWQRRVAVHTGGTQIEIPFDPAWNRHDLYVGVVAFRPASKGDRVTPSRALGLVHLPLKRDERRLKLSLTAPAKSEPDQRVPVKVKLTDRTGKAVAGSGAIVTLSAVDVGILNITRYATPDPADFFFGKHRFGADLLDLYGKLIERLDGSLAKQRYGGDAAKRDMQPRPQKVRLVDLWSGPLALDANGEATIPLALPDFNGTLKLMAVASTADGYANAGAEMIVAAPIAAELAMPRFIAPGDSGTIALDLTNLSGAAQRVKLDIEAGAPLRLTGVPTEPIELADQQKRVLRFKAEATDAFGLAPIKLHINAGPIKIERQLALQVQPLSAPLRQTRRLRIEPDATVQLDRNLTEALWPGSAGAQLTLSSKPPIDVRDAVQGLLMYPYGCLEQTTSSAYPLVFIDEAGAAAFSIKPLSREERARRLDMAFSRLAGMQQQHGGFGLWSANQAYEAWLSAYVAGFLQDAREAGFAVPESMGKRSSASLLEQFQRAPGLQTRFAEPPPRDAQGRLTQRGDVEKVRAAHQRFAEAAHAGYILARDQQAPLATLRSLHDEFRANAYSPLALVHLGLALKLMGDETRAQAAIDEALTKPYGIEPYDGYGYAWLGDYGSPVRDHALAYALLARHRIDDPRREALLDRLANDMEQRFYHSTQERLALFMAARAAGGDAGQPWRVQLSGARRDALTGHGAEQLTLEPAALKRGIGVANRGAQALFVELAVQGYPVKPPAPIEDKVTVERSWWTTDGKRADSGERRFKSGDLLIARLRVSSKQRIKDGLIVDRIPAGFEVENMNLSQGAKLGEFQVEGVSAASALNDPRIKHTEYRDDRFVAAVELDGSRKDLFYLLRVVTPGRYVVPPTYFEDMYRPEIRAVGKSHEDITVYDISGG